MRMVVPLSRSVTREEYQAVSRILGQKIDPSMEHIDKVTFRPAQMMFNPTVSKDMLPHYVFYEQHGAILDVDRLLSDWETLHGPHTNISNLPRAAGEDELRASVDKAEDPLTKKGPVGNFCRAYSITDLVLGKDGEEPILGDVYEIVEFGSDGAASRMTYLLGSTSNGAVVYDDVAVYSHHGSDPAQGKLVNSYDLVRIHKFNAEDDDNDSPMSKRGSVTLGRTQATPAQGVTPSNPSTSAPRDRSPLAEPSFSFPTVGVTNAACQRRPSTRRT